MNRTLDVYLIRHGESEANAAGRLASRLWDPHLTEKGRQEAAALLERLRPLPVVALLSSPLARARETIAPLAEALGLPVTILPDLREVDLGRWDGERLADIAGRDPEHYRRWRQDPERYPPPGGEPIRAVGARVLAALDAWAGDTTGTVIAATHADCLKGVVLEVLDAAGPAARRLLVPNGAVVHLRRLPEGWMLVLDR
ncbi:Histidine phosphatase family protein [Candidatus Hydrogenisulfobacillus filiaventi]|uniref:Histidine phosphatase family protein n=1 Tax=Candidatus Hydrogenisulfobacillus filiaventi TaxID=2707344 RepID=A0A6F8ZD13_9FIRM|nr:histidine phosphatase family protein [Bacillota bacterium]CAB1127906.1 Histidine phosphatase family protein [Candidatus Hydrogenisulfobacillus filiaventi]